MLSKQQLEIISSVLNNVARCHILGTLERSVYLGVDAELYRLANGPYTLAEAIASGRPFRRKAWGDDPGFCRLAKDCSSSWFDFGWQTDCIDPDDIAATDYELMPEEGIER